MKAIIEMQEELKRLDITCMLLKVPESHINLTIFGTKFYINIFKSTLVPGSAINQNKLLADCERLHLFLYAEGLDFWGEKIGNKINRKAKAMNIAANENWIIIMSYIVNPDKNFLAMSRNDLARFWNYAERMLYDEIIPSIEGSWV